MSDPSTLEAPVHHVVHLVPDFETSSAPERLGLPTPFSAAAWVVIRLGLLVGTGLTAWLLAGLWMEETPGLWFQLLFTVFLGGLVLAGWLVTAAAKRTGRARREAALAWATARDRAVASPGRISDRRVQLTDEGAVSGIVVAIDRDDDELVARWSPHPSRTDYLLQPQVPGIGSAVRIWSIPGEPDSPVVVEAIDPTRVS